MMDDIWEQLGQHMLAQVERELVEHKREWAAFIGPRQPPKAPRTPEQFRPGARRLTHIKHTTQRWAAH